MPELLHETISLDVVREQSSYPRSMVMPEPGVLESLKISQSLHERPFLDTSIRVERPSVSIGAWHERSHQSGHEIDTLMADDRARTCAARRVRLHEQFFGWETKLSRVRTGCRDKAARRVNWCGERLGLAVRSLTANLEACNRSVLLARTLEMCRDKAVD